MHDGQSVESLREEAHGLARKGAERMDTVGKRLQQCVDDLSNRCDSLQAQITDIVERKAEKEREC